MRDVYKRQVTEVTTEAGSEETEKDIAEVKESEEKTGKEDNQSAYNETASDVYKIQVYDYALAYTTIALHHLRCV